MIDGSTAGILPEKMLEKIKAMQAKMHFRREFSHPEPVMQLHVNLDHLRSKYCCTCSTTCCGCIDFDLHSVIITFKT